MSGRDLGHRPPERGPSSRRGAPGLNVWIVYSMFPGFPASQKLEVPELEQKYPCLNPVESHNSKHSGVLGRVGASFACVRIRNAKGWNS